METKKVLLISSLIISFVILPVLLFAGTTGKIAGNVKDIETGEPLPGCNVQIVNTNMGAATDGNGEYFIINVPPGQYTVRTSMIGYKTVNTTNVQVMVDLTTRLNFSMEQTVLDIGEEITVVAERPLVQKDITSKI